LETEARRLASELRDGFLLLTASFFIGLAQGNLGRMSDALATLSDGIVKARRNGDLFWGPRMPNCIGWLHRELQNFPEALKFDQEGCEVAREHHVLEAEANSLTTWALTTPAPVETDKTLSAFMSVISLSVMRGFAGVTNSLAGGNRRPLKAQGNLKKHLH
jgi:hypothetical protein